VRATREGKRFLLSTFLIAVAAFNTGNNLMYLILAMMLAVLAVSYVLLGINLKGLSLAVAVNQPVFAGQGFRMDLSVKNGKSFPASWSLRVRLPGALKGEGYVTHAPASSTAHGHADVVFRNRGIYSLGDFIIESSFPFIFFTKRIKARVEGEVTVYPEIKDVELPALFRGRGDEGRSARPGRGEELFMMREFRHGDDMKMVHWKASAKADKLMVREPAEEEPRAVTVVLDDAGRPEPAVFERCVTYAASAAWKLIEDGFFVALVTSSKHLPFGGGREQLYKILDALAAIEEKETSDCPADDEITGGRLLVLKSGTSALRGLAASPDEVVHASDL
jgi:uncharacterized protein (DUF58 family)